MADKQHLFSATSWLLKAAMLILVFITAILALAFAAITLGLVGLLFAPDLIKHLDIPFIEDGIPVVRALGAVLLAVGGGLISIILVLFAVRATSGIVDTAIAGDPFVGDNAGRLNRIGLLLLAIMVVQFLTLIIVAAVAPEAGHFPDFQISGGSEPDPVGMLAILLIFVLARIFRHGAEMRAELEGTV